jgi:hypothetical protein
MTGTNAVVPEFTTLVLIGVGALEIEAADGDGGNVFAPDR